MNGRQRKHILVSIFLAVWLFSLSVFAQSNQSTPKTNTADAPPNLTQIINTFLAKEIECRKWLTLYSYRGDLTLRNLGKDGNPAGDYRRTGISILGSDGDSAEKISFFPAPTLTGINFSEENLKSFNIKFFTLDVSSDSYNFKYAGKERIDELNLFIFDIEPKIIPNPKASQEQRFQGRIWVDDQDFQIVKTFGKSMQAGNLLFTNIEVTREYYDNKYCFPSYIFIKEGSVTANGQNVNISMVLRLHDFNLVIPASRLQ